MAKREKQTQPKKPTSTYQFRIYPTKKHIRILNEWLALCCEVYNAALDERTGYPRFKSRFRYASLTLKHFGNSFNFLTGNKQHQGTLVLAKLGHVKMVMHRAIKATPKTAIVKRTSTGKWFVTISVEMGEEQVASKRLPAVEAVVGIDVGLKSFAYLSTGEEIANPRFFRREEAALVVRVNPAYTSRTCSACGHRQPMPLSVRVYECPHVVWSSSATIMGVSIAYPMLFKPVDEQAESFQKPPATSRGESSRVYS
jgi:transposase